MPGYKAHGSLLWPDAWPMHKESMLYSKYGMDADETKVRPAGWCARGHFASAAPAESG